MGTRLLFKLFAVGLVFSHATLYAQRYEAENATLAGGAAKQNNASLSGGQYVAQNAGSLTFTISLSSEGFYNVYLKAAAPNGEKINKFSVNNNTIDFKLTDPGYITLKVVSGLKLAAGSHTLKILNSWGYINIDYIELEKIPASNRFTPNKTLVTPNPTNGAARLYQFLYDNYGSKIISGVMTFHSMDEVNWLKANTGREPALVGLDFMHCGRNYNWYNDEEPINDAKAYYLRNGIPTFCWHWRDPSRLTEEFYSNKTSFDISKVFDTNSTEYQKMIEDIDFISGLLKKLQDDDVPVIWRPLHEAAGGWFWWGAKGAAPCKKLYQIMYDRMVNHHGLKNLIWVWTREPNDDDWYPGDEYIDIVSRDIYKDGDHSSQILEFLDMNERYGKKKIVTLSECGSFPDPDNLVADGAAWSWFMPWYGKFVNDATYNSLSLWLKAMEHNHVITLDEMPDLSTYEAVSPDPHEPTDPILDAGDESNKKITVYPSRVDEQFTVSSDKPVGLLSMFSANGKLIFNDYYTSNRIVISCRSLPAGLYILRDNSGKTHRIIKQ